MSTWSKWVVVVAILTVLIPFIIVFIRRWVRGELRDGGINSMLPPPGPGIGGV